MGEFWSLVPCWGVDQFWSLDHNAPQGKRGAALQASAMQHREFAYIAFKKIRIELRLNAWAHKTCPPTWLIMQNKRLDPMLPAKVRSLRRT